MVELGKAQGRPRYGPWSAELSSMVGRTPLTSRQSGAFVGIEYIESSHLMFSGRASSMRSYHGLVVRLLRRCKAVSRSWSAEVLVMVDQDIVMYTEGY